jgi:hypothetical protein
LKMRSDDLSICYKKITHKIIITSLRNQHYYLYQMKAFQWLALAPLADIMDASSCYDYPACTATEFFDPNTGFTNDTGNNQIGCVSSIN